MKTVNELQLQYIALANTFRGPQSTLQRLHIQCIHSHIHSLMLAAAMYGSLAVQPIGSNLGLRVCPRTQQQLLDNPNYLLSRSHPRTSNCEIKWQMRI